MRRPNRTPIPATDEDRSPGLSRRALLGGLGLAGAGAAVAGVAGCGSASDSASAHSATVPFYGAHQAGIATPAQDRLAFAAFDLSTGSRADLITLLTQWTAAAEAMTRGSLVPGGSSELSAPPADTGEAVGLSPANLTVTVGFGPSLFDDRFGLAGRRPAALADIPALPADDLDPTISNGDLCVQACANDPVVAFHVVRNLARIGRAYADLRWSQLGFGRTSSTSTKQETERNLFGFKDGTRNIKAEDQATMQRWVWADGEQDWMRGGSYLVSRKIRMRIEAWDRDYLQNQEDVFGRQKLSGAPLTGSKEFDTPDLSRRADGQPMIPADAHIRLANRETNGGVQILRRGYSYTDGITPEGELDAGLFFIAFQKDPRSQFVTLQRKLGAMDALNEYISHTSSAVFACPPGVAKSGDYWGSALFA